MKNFSKRIGAWWLGCLLLAGNLPVHAVPKTDASDTYGAKTVAVTGSADVGTSNTVSLGSDNAENTLTGARANTAQIPVSLWGKEVAGNGAKLISGLTYVPLRTFVGKITDGKAIVTWNGSTKTATVRTDTLTMTVGEGAIYLSANGRCFYTEGSILNQNGTLYVPLRPVARAFGLTVAWNASTRSVTLTGDPHTYVLPSADEVYDKDELYWLSRIISAESRGEPMKGQIAVGNVVQNRVRSKEFPNSIYGVIFDRKYGIQFTPVATGTIYKTPAVSSVAAAKICLEGYTVSREALYFFNPELATSFWISKYRTYLFTIGTHRFYK